MTERVVKAVVRVETLPLCARGSRRLIVRWSDGSESCALEWYADEWLVSEGDLVGRTQAEVRSLAHARDVQHLQEPPEDPNEQPYFRPDP